VERVQQMLRDAGLARIDLHRLAHDLLSRHFVVWKGRVARVAVGLNILMSLFPKARASRIGRSADAGLAG